MQKPQPPARFSSAEEERSFWDEHDPSDFFTDPAEVIVRLQAEKKRTVSVRLDEGLYAELREVAQRHGVPYQRLMRELLRESLRALAHREGRESKAGQA